MRSVRRVLRPITERFRRNTAGAAAVEFALVSTILFVLLGGALDLNHLVTVRRDNERVAVEVAQTLAACTSSPCVLKAGQTIMERQKNAFLTTSTPTISWAYVSRVDTKIVVSFGNMTYLESDVEAAAKAALPATNDNGVCSVVTSKVTSLGILKSWFTEKQGKARYFICTLQSKNVKVV
jgi:Flp pilus assembly protein TadG